jgi:serine/threonine-protein kinase RsbW
VSCSLISREWVKAIPLKPPLFSMEDQVPTEQLKKPLESCSRIFESTLASVELAEDAALEIAQATGFRGDELEKIGLAVREVVANAVIHGNRLDPAKKVVLTATRTADRLDVRVWDQGKGFDMESLENNFVADVLLRDSGRGIYLARAFMDEFRVHNGAAGGTTVSLTKFIRPKRRGAK